MRKNRHLPEAETAEQIRARISSDVHQFLDDLSDKYSLMAKRGRKHLSRSLAEAAVFVTLAQKKPSMADAIQLDEAYDLPENSTDDVVKKVVYRMMKPEGKDQLTMASKYITTIRYLISEGVKGDDFVASLKRVGGIEAACKKYRAKIKGSIDSDIEKTREEDTGSASPDRNGWPRINEEWLESHAHIYMGTDNKLFEKPGTYTMEVKVEDGEGYKQASGKILKFEE